MSAFYSASKNSFFNSAWRLEYELAGSWPEDSIEVPDEIFLTFGINQAPDGKARVAGIDGMPSWQNLPASPVIVPATVTRYQARAALLQAGMLKQVEDYFAALTEDDLDKLAWMQAPTVTRNSNALGKAAQSLGLTNDQLDEMFIAASKFP